jgi:hypothetical protein
MDRGPRKVADFEVMFVRGTLDKVPVDRELKAENPEKVSRKSRCSQKNLDLPPVGFAAATR